MFRRRDNGTITRYDAQCANNNRTAGCIERCESSARVAGNTELYSSWKRLICGGGSPDVKRNGNTCARAERRPSRRDMIADDAKVQDNAGYGRANCKWDFGMFRIRISVPVSTWIILRREGISLRNRDSQYLSCYLKVCAIRDKIRSTHTHTHL